MDRLLLLFFLFILSCHEIDKQDKLINVSKPQPLFIHSSFIDVLSMADSASILFYDTPNNFRYFKYAKITDMRYLSNIVVDLQDSVVQKSAACKSNGKIYFYGEDDHVNTVYFCTDNPCMCFSFLINGNKYFVKMTETSYSLLGQLRNDAIRP